MSRIQDSIRNIKNAQGQKKKPSSSTGDSALERVAVPNGKLPQSILEIPKKQRAILDRDHLTRNRIVHDDFAADAVGRYKMLRTRVLQKMDKNDWRILAVTAPHEKAGKSITAINLAITIARSGDRRVYLLDLDLRKPGVARSLGITDIDAGIGHYLSGSKKIEGVLWSIGIDNLFIVPGEGRFENSSELLASSRMIDLISLIRSDPSRPIIIVDLPPVLAADDALAVAPIVDSLLFVVAEGETPRADIKRSLELLKDVNLLGVVLNKSRDSQPGY